MINGTRVLLVDDNWDVADLYAALLRDRGADVLVAHSVHDAVEAVETYRPDVLLAELTFPDGDAFSLLDAVNTLDACHGGSVAAVLFTGWARGPERSRALDAGYRDHCTKPCRPDALETLVATVALQARTARTN